MQINKHAGNHVYCLKQCTSIIIIYNTDQNWSLITLDAIKNTNYRTEA